MMRIKLFLVSYAAVLAALFLYSFTQVDLSLTLSKFSIYQVLEKSFQNIGFFQRPLSTLIFTVLFSLLFVSYLLFLYLAKKGKVKLKHLKIMILLTFGLLVFSYNAFSYDLFNYIFDAKILTHYHLNPYFYSALDFPNDPMLHFMRWTHRVYPYGPSWLILTVPLSFVGMGIFLPTFFLFKFLMGLSYLGSCFLIYKISGKVFPENKLLNLSFWAFNPLVIIESLVSAHNDIPMIFFMLLSFYLFLEKKKLSSIFSYLFSVGVKYSTGAFLPLFIALLYFERTKKQINWEKFFVAAFVLGIITIPIATIRTTFQPWYLLLPLSVASFIPKKYYIFIPSFTATVFSAAIYIPYVYMTDYAKGYPQVIFNIEAIGVLAVFLFTLLYFLKKRLLFKN